MSTPPTQWNVRAGRALRAHFWLIVSLIGNIFLVFYLYIAMDPWRAPPVPEPVVGLNPILRTNVIVRHENFTWDQLESTNYVTFIKNLRAVGCPEPTIRDMIVADVNRIYARRRLDEVTYPNYQWWRSEPDPAVVQAATTKLADLENERRGILTSLLGPDWDAQDNEEIAARAGITLTGPLLGDLPPDAKAQVYAVVAKGQLKIEAYEAAQRTANKPVDPMEIVRLREEALNPLVTLINPSQYEEFLLRYSPGAQQLREHLRALELTPDQFRELFNAAGGISGQPVFYYAGNDPALIAQRQQLRAQEEAIIKETLGDQAYAAYQLNQDPLYQSSKSMADQLGLPETEAGSIYEINRATQAELKRIRTDPDLTADEKVEAISQTQVEQQQSLEQLLGPEKFQAWLTNGAFH